MRHKGEFMDWSKKLKGMSFIVTGLFVVVGTYNAVVINSESHLYSSDVKFVRRLDEMYGITVPGREVAASVDWKKIASAKKNIAKENPKIITQTVTEVAAAPTPAVTDTPTAAIQEELELNLVEVINTTKWKNGLPNNQFQGNLVTNNGVIESLGVDLPNGEGISVSFSEMTGNVFEYDLNGELYSGMMYQVDQNSYMVTLSNGPLEGTRLRFSATASESEQQQTQEYLAENNVTPGNFGDDTQAYDQQIQAEEAQNEQARTQIENGTFSSPEEASNYDQQAQQEGLQAQANVNQTAESQNDVQY